MRGVKRVTAGESSPLCMPLAVGVTSSAALAVVALALGPIAWLGDSTLSHLRQHDWLAGFGLLAALAYLVTLLVTRARRAWRQRPSDIALDERGIRVIGGPFSGSKLSWADLDRDATRLEGNQLILAARDGRRFVLAEASAAVELASLDDLARTLRATAYDSEPAAARDQGPRPFSCGACGAPVQPVDAEYAPCAHCGAKKQMAPELRQRIRAASDLYAGRPTLERRVRALLRQPGARRASSVLGFVAALMLAAWGGGIGLYRFQREHADVLLITTAFSIWLFPMFAIVGLFLVHRATLVDRVALGLLTLGAGARRGPARTALCHSCGAALPESADVVVVRCPFCAADSVTGLDLRDVAGRERRESKSVEATLAERRRARLVYGVGGGALGVVVLAHAARLFAQGNELTLYTDVVRAQAMSGHQVYEVDAAVTDPAISRDGARLLVIRRAPSRAPELCRVLRWDELSPVWSAPGLASPAWLDKDHYLVIASDGAGAALHLADLGGGPGRVVYRAPELSHPSPSPKGDRVVVGAKLEGRWMLVIVPLGAGEPTPLFPGRSPDWHPSDDTLVFVREVEGVPKLYVVDLDDAPPTPVEVVKPNAFRYENPAWSPCGTWIAYATNAGWDRVRTGAPERTLNLFAMTWDPEGAGEHEPKILAFTEGSAAATHPAWGSGHLYWESDQKRRREVYELEPGGEFEMERYSRNVRCAPGVHAE